MNVSGQQALVLADASLPVSVRKPPPQANPDLRLVVNAEPRTDVVVVNTRSPTTLVLVHGADHFSRGNAGDPSVLEADYSNLRPGTRDLQSGSHPEPRLLAARHYASASTAGPIALYASIEGTVTGNPKGSLIDIFV